MGALKTGRRFMRIWAFVGLTALLVGGAWVFFGYRATSDAKAALASDARVKVGIDGEVIRFSSTAQHGMVPVGLVFFPGSMVEPAAYAPLAHAIAAAGYPVTLVPLPRRGAFINSDVSAVLHTTMNAIHEDERARQWVIAGHSLGAVVATRLASEATAMGARTIAGLLLIGTTHPRDVDLSTMKLQVTKIVGTKDGVATLEKAEANRKLLPPNTRWIQIEGGNHSQFGWYGFQPGDRFASISRDAQHRQMIDAVLETLRLSGDKSDWLAPARRVMDSTADPLAAPPPQVPPGR